MASLVVTRTTDYRSTNLSDVTSVEFAAPDITATFNPDSINPGALWIGHPGGPVTIRLVAGVPTVFDGRGWQFSGFGNSGNSIAFVGSIHADTFYGTSRAETIRGDEGDDTIYSSPGADSLTGGSGNDTFWFIERNVTVTDIVSGDRGTNDRIVLSNTGTYDFSQTAVTGIEELEFHALGEAILDTSQIGGRGKIRLVDGSGGADSLIVRSDGSGVSLAGLSFTGWHRSATITIEGRTEFAETLTGSARKDVIVLAGQDDQASGRGGNDVFEVSFSLPLGSIDGGVGTDRILGVGPGTLQFNGTEISNVEILDLGGCAAAILSADHTGTGGTRLGITTIIGNDQNNVVEVQGSYIDLLDVRLENWTEELDRLVLRGTSGNDVVAGSAYADYLHDSEGGDDISLGEGDDTIAVSGQFGSGTTMEGGGGSDTLFIASRETVDVRDMRLIGFEELRINSEFTNVVRFSGDQIGGAAALQVVDLSGSDGRIIVTGSDVDLSSVVIANAGPSGQLAVLRGTAQADDLTGSSLGDEFDGTGGADHLSGGLGIDSLDYSESAEAVIVSLAGGTAESGDAEGDVITGIENVIGSAFDDRLTGDAQDNLLQGRNGDDTLTGGNGTDSLEGGNGDDVFSFSSTGHSGFAAQADRILDFRDGGDADVIRLSAIDADPSTGTDDAFSFIGAAAFTAAGQIRVVAEGADTLVLLNTVGSDDADMEIRLVGVAPDSIASQDFIL